ncbi:MAG TPA: RsmF rRNA methyltransferase first C-terminal domain-containing protein [Anaerolineales bacterium]|nr:RsmF rRNA methyltransferase first C-terminal domain-containing protein [Anaerolineales bacterium]
MTQAAKIPLDIPPAFLQRMQGLLGEGYPAFLACLQEEPTAGLRVNSLKISPQEFVRISPFSLKPIPDCPEGFTVEKPDKPGRHPYHAAGLYYLQDPSAMAVALALDPQPGERVLDLAAAPGGKATHIASLLGGQGLLVANEIHPQRAWELAQNLERWGARNTVITNETPEHLADELEGFFDKVLLDAPCSGEGMFRKSEAARRDWSLEAVQSCALRQGAILEQAGRLVRPGGALVYSTCTFSPEENEGVLAAFLQRRPEFKLVQIDTLSSPAHGRAEWLLAQATTARLDLALRLWPQDGMGEGHFIAKMGKNSAGQLKNTPPRLKRPLAPQIETYFKDFASQALITPEIRWQPELFGSYLYQIPAQFPEMGSLRVLHPGWWLGTLKARRFEPSHALALGLRGEQARQVVALNAQEVRLQAYLGGEQIPAGAQDGWALILVDGYPLGWGKCSQGVVKNFYPKGLRRS